MLIAVLGVAVLGVAIAGSPVLLFPELLPSSWRLSVVTLLTLFALGSGLVLLAPWKRLRVGLSILALAVVGSWVATTGHDLVGLRHFAGIGMGLLSMGIVARWCTNRDRLMTAALLFTGAAALILTVGLLGAASNFNTTKFVTWFNLLPPRLLERLLRFRLGLPGLEASGRVNTNALGGTALLLLPTSAGVAAAALAPTSRRLTLLVAGVATTIAVAVLAVTLSRTAWLAAFGTLLVFGLRARRGRRAVLLVIAVMLLGAAYGTFQWRAAGVAMFDRDLRASLGERGVIWREAAVRLRDAPWLGIGISQFHEIGPALSRNDETQIAHAHNTLLQVALDIGLPGLCGYVLVIAVLLREADRAARQGGSPGRIAAGAGLSLIGAHFFGLGDAIALGAKMGLFQWLCGGLILAAAHLAASSDRLAGFQDDRHSD